MSGKEDQSPGEVRIIPTTCAHDCGANSNCVLKLHVRDGVIIRIETDDGPEPQLRACARGRAQRKRVYAPDRLKYPMRRVGERGEGKFKRISWDEALDQIAHEMKRIKESYGPGAFVNLQYAGEFHLQGPAVGRLMNLFGGNLQHWGGASLEGNYWSAQATYGSRLSAPRVPERFDARLIILWAWNPANNQFKVNNPLRMAQAKEAGSKIICVDPRYTVSAALYADEWIPIIPGTDTAMLVAMAYVIITENLQDQAFLDTYTVGFNRFKEYVLGIEDGVAKTPAWAENITSVPAATTERLAREYATTKPAMLLAAWAPGRTAYGEQYFRAANTLMAMTGEAGVLERATPLRGLIIRPPGFGKGKNPFDYEPATSGPTGKNSTQSRSPDGPTTSRTTFDFTTSSRVGGSLDPVFKTRRRVLQNRLYDAILQGTSGGYPSDVKMVWVNCGNTLNQFANTNKGVKAFKQLEFVVVSEQFMTPTARFADILLPVRTHFERNSIYSGGGDTMFFANKAIEPVGESKSDFQICVELAPRLGIDNYSDKTEEQWLEWELNTPQMKKYVTDYEAFKKQGVYKLPPTQAEEAVAPGPHIEGEKNKLFPTPSGKVEIYSQLVADLNNPEIPPIAKYIETWESRNDPLAKKYPLQLISTHFKLRAHSNFHNVSWLRELEPQRVWINTGDAEARGVHDGEEVRVFNDRGEMIIPAFVTETIMPGVVNISEGAWYNPDDQGIDRGGCPNVLTRDEPSPAGAWTTHTCLVQVSKV
ncbi:molybdopterin-dependent oxidoreductase [Thermodesulfobacteriota bacterium]